MRRDPSIYLLAIGQTLIWASIYYIFPALLLRWEQELGWSKADLTAAITTAVLVSAMMSPITGRIIDRGHGVWLITASSLLGGMGLVLLSFVTALWQFYAVWVLMGVAMAGSLYEPCFAILTRARGANAKKAIIFITLVAGFASTISYPSVYTLAEAFGWRNAARIAAGVVIFIAAPLLWLGVRRLTADPVQPTSATPRQESSRAFLKTAPFWFLAAGFACLATAHGAALHHLLPLLNEQGLSAETAVLAASFIGPMQVAGRLAMMASASYLSNHGVAIATYSVLGLAMVMLLLSATSPLFLSGFVILFGAAAGTASILRPLLARDILGESGFGAKSGTLALSYLSGSALGPFLGSLIWNIGGYDLMLGTLTGFALVGALFYSRAHHLAVRE